ncbi:MAG: iron ABC transporter permease [Rhodothermales bacterium]|nr:iron ABC transporter permease [Rhodothermales bacterium]MBO6780085.1 iron ABC transporter permease [Rhodothermales bacterium]
MNRILVAVGLGVLTPVTLIAGVAIGSVDVSAGDALSVFLSRLGTGAEASPTADAIVWDLRLPRVLMAMIVGGSLAVVGVAMQALVRNPLAEPYILGLSSGSAAGAATYYLGYLPAFAMGMLSMPVAAFLGGLLTITLVYGVARTDQGLSVTRLLLAGVAMSALMAAITSFVMLTSPEPNRMRAVLYWLMGSLSATRWSMLATPALVAVLGSVVLAGLSRPLDALLMGEEPARALGVPVERMKHLLIVLAALMTGVMVAYSGAIGFVGLIVPHAVRSVVGVSHRVVIPVSLVSGALFLVWADLAARSVLSGQDLPVGIATAIAGVPFFLMLLRRHRYPFG